jgi:hypothetical protein
MKREVAITNAPAFVHSTFLTCEHRKLNKKGKGGTHDGRGLHLKLLSEILAQDLLLFDCEKRFSLFTNSNRFFMVRECLLVFLVSRNFPI